MQGMNCYDVRLQRFESLYNLFSVLKRFLSVISVNISFTHLLSTVHVLIHFDLRHIFLHLNIKMLCSYCVFYEDILSETSTAAQCRAPEM